MLIENFTTTSAQLNGVSGVVHTLTKETLAQDDANMGNKFYSPSAVTVYNNTGATAYFIPMTEFEYDNWGITYMIPVANNIEKTIDGFSSGEITRIVASGTTGHSSDLTITVFKE